MNNKNSVISENHALINQFKNDYVNNVIKMLKNHYMMINMTFIRKIIVKIIA